MNAIAPRWLLLVVSLPTASATARMRLWRALKTLGCVALRDGAYLLPAAPARNASLRALADDCIREGGTAWLMNVEPATPEEDATFQALFDRSDDYAEARTNWRE